MAGDSIEAVNTVEPNGIAGDAGLEGFEISPQQRRIWSLQPHTSALYAQITVEIEGSLDTERLKRATEKVAAKHEILRTNFRHVPGRIFPVQVIHATLPPEWREMDLENLDPAAR